MMFQVPSFVQQEIFPLSEKQEKALKAVDVIKLTCGKYQFSGDDTVKSQHDIDGKLCGATSKHLQI